MPASPWSRFARLFLTTALSLLGFIYLFTVTIDPWDVLPYSPPLPRVPISSNARFSFPALARSPRFDSAVFGDSSARLLRPVELDPGFHARFVNLAMNAATAYEQSRMLDLFLRAHPQPRVIIVSLDQSWCAPQFERFTPRPFPAWMYDEHHLRDYLEMFTPFAVQEAWNQFAVMIGLKHRRYGLDGYTSFVPPESAYDPARRDRAFLLWGPRDDAVGPPPANITLPAMDILDHMLDPIPPQTRIVLYFTPSHIDRMGAPGSGTAWQWQGCKRAATAIAARHGALLMDFLIPSTITQSRDNFWDPVHYRQPIASRVTEGLVHGESPDAVVLVPPKAGL